MSERMIFRPIPPIGGVEVGGIDLRQEQTPDVKQRLRATCLEYSMLLIRDQELTFDEQLRYGRFFGDVLETSAPSRNGSAAPKIAKEGQGPTAKLLLHFDHWLVSAFPQPLSFTMLFGMQVTPVGGETIFVNAGEAYRRLPGDLKSRIEERQALHCYDYSDTAAAKVGVRVRERDLPAGQPCATHPVVLRHPETGKAILYISPGNTDRILGLEQEESESLFRELCKYLEDPDYLYTHRWSVGDLLVWDNYALLHGRRSFDSRYPRSLRRLSIL